MSREIIFFLIIFIYIFTIVILDSLKLTFFSFFVGSVGFFSICIKYFLPAIDRGICGVNEMILNFLSNVFGNFQVFKNYSMVGINTKEGIVSMIINYECSGVIEIMVFVSLAIFFPFGGKVLKFLSLVLGCIYIFAANILRILLIIFITVWYGEDYFYIAHTFFARILFFSLVVILYYIVFSKVQLQYQKVGES
ncbi:MAG: exosortase family protein XrtG [Clostridiaceae bacterium]